MATDEDGIRTTIAQYCHFCDDGRFEEWADLYTEDAVFEVFGTEHRGRETVRAFIEKAQPPEKRGKHVCFNSVIEVTGDTARAWTDFIFLATTPEGPAITNTGRYHDRFRRDPDRWRFVERHIVFPGEDQ
jgi:ketosteroid isomerase-like protein